MIKTIHNSLEDSFFVLSDVQDFSQHIKENSFKIIWNTKEKTLLRVDHEQIELGSQEVISLAPNQHIEWISSGEGYVFQYNRDFYCIIDHDKEIGCAGILYFGRERVPVIRLDPANQKKFERLLEVFLDEFETEDNIQESMLRMLLKRLIILSTRLLKQQSHALGEREELEIIRHFHVLVEQHFRTKQKVADYAAMLFKSPKTLSNLFAQNNELPPLKQIQERVALEAKRLLLFTDKAIKEISWELNFDEVSHFSRFFKRMVGQTPSAFRKSQGLTQVS